MRVGVFGGTFDPVHLGHLILAEQCREQGRLDQVWFVPAARPPNKLDEAVTPFAHRVEMLALAIAGHPAFAIDPLEKERDGPSFTVDTLRTLHERHHGYEFWLMLGSDSLLDLPNWRAPEQIVALAGLLVVGRPGHPAPGVEPVRAALRLADATALRLQSVESPLIDIASRDLRRRVREGRSIRYLVPRAVEAYIAEKRLYREES
jgi:nicotinate-nucleotide adenylyltransferase